MGSTNLQNFIKVQDIKV